MKLKIWVFCACIISICGFSQAPQKQNSLEILNDIKALNFLGTVLYVAAHPDDENTRLIAYCANNLHADTYYLSLTRGDGGQNLLGSDFKEALGIIRTEELLAARQVDGGQQRFTRAVDFGYSKSPKETLSFWKKDSVLSDVVWTIRTLKPDVIINRFDHRTPGTTHGHHTASAMLSLEAFDITADKTTYPKQLKYTDTWQPKRLFFNTSWWFYGSREKFEKADKSNLVSLDIGKYYPDLGLSNSEIASISRSQHKSQAFGNTPVRGEQQEYLEIIKGDMPSNNDIFDGIDTSWNRVKGGNKIQNIIDQVIADYDYSSPYKSVPRLIEAYNLIQKLDDEHWKNIKTRQIQSIIKSCLGLYMEAVSTSSTANPEENIEVRTEITNRSPVEISLVEIKDNYANVVYSSSKTLKNNIAEYLSFELNVNAQRTMPYWLEDKPEDGIYSVSNPLQIGLPKTPQPLSLNYTFNIAGTRLVYNTPVMYKYNSRVDGEVFEDFHILPEISIEPRDEVVIFNNSNTKSISVQIESYTDAIEGRLFVDLPKNWSVSPNYIDFSLNKKGELKSFNFNVTPPNETQKIEAKFLVKSNNNTYTKKINVLDYDHIPKQHFSEEASTSLVYIDVKQSIDNVGYVSGAGDKVPESLRSLGLNVEEINLDDVTTAEDLYKYEAIVMGVRAFNTQDQLVIKNDFLFDYVKNGGVLINQYNTTYSLKTDKVSPLNLKISRERVTNELAEVKFLEPNHPILNFPNKITQKDFEGWVQERGLYFPNQWDERFSPILEIQDYEEAPTKGSLLVAPYGEGYYIYTGLSLFRQLPAGVPGAYRLLSNLLSIKGNYE
jgi:LmbE family N-acetylglucosaminyl deacetylase